MRKLSKTQQADLSALASLPDSAIDMTDIPEVKSLDGGVRGRFYPRNPEQVAIHLSATDAEKARRISEEKGIPYPEYLGKLLHEALAKARASE